MYVCVCVLLSQANTWKNTEILSGWIHNRFVPAVTKQMKEKGLAVKTLLLLDNAPAHPDAESLVGKERNIKATFLPSNTTALIQPMAQGVANVC